jgi:putative endopeptidase
MSLERIDTVLIAQPGYYQALDKTLPTAPISLLKDHLVFDVLDHNASLLSKAFEQASFDFNSKTLYGQPQLPERWKRIAEYRWGAGRIIGATMGQKVFPGRSQRANVDARRESAKDISGAH